MNDFCKEKIILMLESINDEKFLNQILTLLKRHVRKKREGFHNGKTER